jgi:hypothetical protein
MGRPRQASEAEGGPNNKAARQANSDTGPQEYHKESSTVPPVNGETTVGKSSRRTFDRKNLVKERTWKEHDLILQWINEFKALCRDRTALRLVSVENPQLASCELTRFTVKKINKRQFSAAKFVIVVVSMRAKEFRVVGRRQLYFQIDHTK